ncbi:MAG: efflux RND transporter periplasmic adaptor subunit [Bacteroidetes bacterium]|nr:efflux RND transporter periplasmic adaptor subunit [Bacteroidota bacterium]
MNSMYKYLLLFLPFAACQSNEAPVAEASVEVVSEKQDLSAVLNSNPSIEIGPIQTQRLQEEVSCTGRMELPPTELMSIHSRMEGFVEEIRFLPGDYIKKGSILARIHNPQLVEKQRLLLETKAELSLAEKDYQRRLQLKEADATSGRLFDESLAKKEMLSARYKGLRSELSLIGVDVDRVEKEQAFQSRISVYAPKNAWLHEVLVNAGQHIEPSDKLMDLAGTDHLHLELQVLSRDLPGLEKGMKVTYTLPGDATAYEASIVKINPMVEPETQTLMLHCHLDTGQEKARPGMFINAVIKKEAGALSGLPTEAVIKEGESYYAYFVEGEELQKRKLEQVRVFPDFISFEAPADARMVVAGAYYVE